ncbi:rhodanese-like domain-containing protein [Candidatus Saccharibacteria bacterium]|nr:MAG: rhodanese-like domain-containing protein [Candidatus Saccharibacteria bacterium]
MGGFLLISRPDSSSEINKQPAAKLTFGLVKNEVEKGSAMLLDVREPEEYASGHFPGALNLSLQNIEAGKRPDSAKTQPLYIYCRSGNRSAQATTILKNSGYTVITDLGGLDDVTAMGGTLIK